MIADCQLPIKRNVPIRIFQSAIGNRQSLPRLRPRTGVDTILTGRRSYDMRLTDILKPQNILIPMQAKTKNDAIGELVSLLAGNGEIQDGKAVLDAVLERETTRTTGIGNGLAIPHGKCAGTTQLVMAIGKLAAPIDFQSIDGRPVSLIWLLSSPPDKTGPHIHALARISRLMTIDKFRQTLNSAKTAKEMFDAIAQQESSL
jgi:fructose-specific phosphotransferase system IIA component